MNEILIVKMKMKMGENMNDKMMATRNGKMKNEDEWEYNWTPMFDDMVEMVGEWKMIVKNDGKWWNTKWICWMI